MGTGRRRSTFALVGTTIINQPLAATHVCDCRSTLRLTPADIQAILCKKNFVLKPPPEYVGYDQYMYRPEAKRQQAIV